MAKTRLEARKPTESKPFQDFMENEPDDEKEQKDRIEEATNLKQKVLLSQRNTMLKCLAYIVTL